MGVEAFLIHALKTEEGRENKDQNTEEAKEQFQYTSHWGLVSDSCPSVTEFQDFTTP